MDLENLFPGTQAKTVVVQQRFDSLTFVIADAQDKRTFLCVDADCFENSQVFSDDVFTTNWLDLLCVTFAAADKTFDAAITEPDGRTADASEKGTAVGSGKVNGEVEASVSQISGEA